ncbi:hypothetical protein EIP91_008030 [Steccherinum ochraceum]|uniref:BTB domain-containing protein n=1 Tax=Steccherinum ochraceum TaxID=92696 RepID=A0A4R0R3D0_9APHY|nr:hypothetical protein EIP91_008030 [Steccherinum ochraceum]
MSTHPPHILIARNSRGPNPSAALSSPTETHAAAAGIFRSAGSPPWNLEECETDDLISDMSTDGDYDDSIDIDHTFTKNSRMPGTVKIIVQGTTFWAHKEVLYFASPFFEAALSGSWAETGRPTSTSSVITIPQPPTVPGENPNSDTCTEIVFAPVDPDIYGDDSEIDMDFKDSEDEHTDNGAAPGEDERAKEEERKKSLDILQSGSQSTLTESSDTEKTLKKAAGAINLKEKKAQAKVQRKTKTRGQDAVIVLKEEKASTFHDFLRWIYPHLVCTITWNNVEGLMNISHKLSVTALQQACLNFLLTHAAGRPIKAMRIAELFEEEELYRESSRFVLDNPGGWTEQEMSTLSPETLLKLEKRRTWFLERVLKLGLVQMAKEYQCCPTCPEPAICARLLDDKWRQSYQAMFRFGPCQPSMVFRYLRMLEGVSPPLQLTHLNCQATAKAFAAALFDRMFSLGMRGNGPDAQPLGTSRVAATAAAATTGPRRHFIYCTLKAENPNKTHRTQRSRDFLSGGQSS